MPHFSWLAIPFLMMSSVEASISRCEGLCRRLSTDSAKARCHSCKCKEALDDWLPSRAELQCGKGSELIVYRSNTSSPQQLEPVYEEVATCHNPALFGGACAPGGRLGQLSRGDIRVKWICRRDKYSPRYNDPVLPFDKVAIIGHNQRTGATCWWEDKANGIHSNNLPSLDIADAPTDEVIEYGKHFNVTEGYGCIYCHDNDPFLYTPHLKSSGWQSGSYKTGPFGRVMLQGPPVAVGTKMLTAPAAKSCTSCHRIATGRSCSSWSGNSMGHEKEFGHEAIVLDAVDRIVEEGGVKKRLPGEEWNLAYWMPPKFDGDPATGWAQWHDRYGTAKEAVLKCCSEFHAGIASPECSWAPVPGPVRD